jgi:hypothetical protein
MPKLPKNDRRLIIRVIIIVLEIFRDHWPF